MRCLLENNLTLHERHELRVLELIEERDKLTQRGVAADLEIAIGMANSLIKRLVRKGYIKIKDVPSSRYGYYLTPQGFLAKSQLVSKYIANSVKFLVKCAVISRRLPSKCPKASTGRLAVLEQAKFSKLRRWFFCRIM